MIVISILIALGILCIVMVVFFITTGRKETNEIELLNKLLEQGRKERIENIEVVFEIIKPS